MSAITWFLGDTCPDPLIARVMSALLPHALPVRAAPVSDRPHPSPTPLPQGEGASRATRFSERPACPAPFPQWVG